MVSRRLAAITGAVAVTLAAAGCSWGGGDDVSATQSEQPVAEMRPVPTVPSSDEAAGAGNHIDPVVDPDAGPPVTEVIGDPQPDPDQPEPLPPLPPSPVVEACDRLSEVGAADAVTASTGIPVDATVIWDQACRLAGSSLVAEVHFVSEADVESDWFRREGIEPVGEIGGDAVGLVGFLAPGSDPAAGYTIALLQRREGVVVAVRGAGDDRVVAAELALLVASSI